MSLIISSKSGHNQAPDFMRQTRFRRKTVMASHDPVEVLNPSGYRKNSPF
jgi:hypothetical protein